MTTTTDQWKITGGWLAAARRVPSPNCNPRPAGAPARVPHRADAQKETDVIAVDAAPLRDGEAIVDTVGAGDAFVGAFVARVARGDSLIRCAAIAAAAGTMACTREGAQGGTHCVPNAGRPEKQFRKKYFGRKSFLPNFIFAGNYFR